MLGKVIPLVGLGYVQITLTLLLANLWFHMPIKGSLPLLYVVSLAFFFSTLGIGALISTVSKTFQQAAQMTQLILMPGILLLRVHLPAGVAAPALQAVGQRILPLTYFVDHSSGAFLIKGVGLEYLWRQIIPMVAIGVAVFALAINRFQKRAPTNHRSRHGEAAATTAGLAFSRGDDRDARTVR